LILHPRVRLREAATFAREVSTLALTRRLESRSLEEIRARQGRMLRQMVSHAYRNVPFYRQGFEAAGVKPGDIRSVDDLDKLPVIDKNQVVANYPDAIIAQGHSPETSYRSATSGSSGLRATFLCDWATRDQNFALLYRSRAMFGYRPRHTECHFTWWPDRTGRWFQKAGFLRRVRVSILDPPGEALARLLEARPDSVFSSPSFLYMLCSAPSPAQTGSRHLASALPSRRAS
jgi:phenylacetate-CoA ligase